jgi:hypothetical protein
MRDGSSGITGSSIANAPHVGWVFVAALLNPPYELRALSSWNQYIEDCKRRGESGSGKNGDFTYGELRDKGSEFRGEKP